MPLKIIIKGKQELKTSMILFIFWKEIQLAIPITKSVIISEISKISRRKTKITAKKVISGCKSRQVWF
jgi:hypothetical protein